MREVPSLGRRGGGWVALQFVLIAVIVASCVWGPRWPDAVRGLLLVIGVLFAVAGAVLVTVAARALGSTITPFPKPPRKGQLVVDGPYRVVRHPIYSGALVVSLGLAMALSPLTLAPTAGLAVLFALKSPVEERFLDAAFPAYHAYRARTRFRLLPFVY